MLIPLSDELLINLLFIMLLSFAWNITVEHVRYNPVLKRWVHILIGGFAIVVCIAFGARLDGNFIFDLRQVPFILVGLAEGPIATIFLLAVTITTRFQFEGYGSYATVFVYSILAISIIIIRPFYLSGSFRRRLLVSSILSVFTSLTMLSSLYYLESKLWNSADIWLTYLLIPSFGTLLLTLINERIQKYFYLNREIYKAAKIHMVSNLAASFGHEVRNPLCVSKGFLQLLLEDSLPAEKKEYVKTALEELVRAEKIIQNYLSYAKPGFEKRERINIHQEMDKALEIVHPLANMNNIFIQRKYESEECWIEGDRNELHQCMLNILKNAIEAMPDGGCLSVDVLKDERDDQMELRIEDTGIGMSKHQIAKLGQPYFTSKENGTGLGMMVVLNIIKSMGGTIEVRSEILKGTTFSIFFPVINSSPETLDVNAS